MVIIELYDINTASIVYEDTIDVDSILYKTLCTGMKIQLDNKEFKYNMEFNIGSIDTIYSTTTEAVTFLCKGILTEIEE